MNANIPVLFRSYESLEPHPNCCIWEAARATSAAPTFFKRIEIGRAQPYIEGGLGRNNPSRVVLDEAKALFGTRHIGCLMSIGTGQVKTIGVRKPGFFQQIVPTDIVDALRAIANDCEDSPESATYDRAARYERNWSIYLKSGSSLLSFPKATRGISSKNPRTQALSAAGDFIYRSKGNLREDVQVFRFR